MTRSTLAAPPSYTPVMARKKKAKTDVEYLRYPGLGFNPEESSATPSAQGQARGIQFVPPAVHASPVANEKKPQGSATGIDVLLSPRTHRDDTPGHSCGTPPRGGKPEPEQEEQAFL